MNTVPMSLMERVHNRKNRKGIKTQLVTQEIQVEKIVKSRVRIILIKIKEKIKEIQILISVFMRINRIKLIKISIIIH